MNNLLPLAAVVRRTPRPPVDLRYSLGRCRYLIVAVYFSFVIGSAGCCADRSKPARITSDPAFAPRVEFAHLVYWSKSGAQEVIGMAASGAKYGYRDEPFLLDRGDPSDGILSAYS